RRAGAATPSLCHPRTRNRSGWSDHWETVLPPVRRRDRGSGCADRARDAPDRAPRRRGPSRSCPAAIQLRRCWVRLRLTRWRILFLLKAIVKPTRFNPPVIYLLSVGDELRIDKVRSSIIRA